MPNCEIADELKLPKIIPVSADDLRQGITYLQILQSNWLMDSSVSAYNRLSDCIYKLQLAMDEKR